MSSSQPTTHIWGATCDTCGGRFTPLKPSHKRCPKCYRAHPLPQRQGGVFRTITSKYPGTCKRCGGSFDAGEKIRYGGKGMTYHLGECLNGMTASGKPEPPVESNISQPMQPQGPEPSVCVHCDEPISYVSTPSRGFWTTALEGAGHCRVSPTGSHVPPMFQVVGTYQPEPAADLCKFCGNDIEECECE